MKSRPGSRIKEGTRRGRESWGVCEGAPVGGEGPICWTS